MPRLELCGEHEAKVTALAVLGSWRGQGIGASLIYGASQHLGLRVLEAETDAHAGAFFRALGFDVESRGGRTRCRLEL